MTTTSQIDSILENRKPIAAETGKTIGQLHAVSAALTNFQCFLPSVASRDIPENTKTQITALQIRLGTFINESIPARIRELGQLQRRFARETLNIGIVGNAGQGKSTFIQSLTNLTDKELPTSSGAKHCTGAPSVIMNDNRIFADVEFYSQTNFIKEIIAPFYSMLQLDNAPASLADFRKMLPTPDFGTDATKQTQFEYLKSLQDNIGLYETLIGRPKIKIEREQFREYIAKIDASGNPIYTWVAVRNVEIHCPFQGADVGAVSMCDTPGMGDFYSAADENLADSVGDNIDAVVMLKRSSMRVGVGDTNLYNLLSKAIPELDREDWSHFILNRDGSASVEEYRAELRDKNIATRRILDVDCRNADEVRKCFGTIIQDIAANQKTLDETLFAKRSENVKALAGELEKFITDANNALPKISDGGMSAAELDKYFAPIFKEFSDFLSLTESYRKNREKPDGELLKKINAIRDNVIKKIHDNLEAVTEKDYQVQTVPNFELEKVHELRLLIASAFDELDDIIEFDFDKLRSEVVSIFQEKGKLAAIWNTDNRQNKDYLLQLAEHWKPIDGSRDIVNAIQRFANALFSFRGNMLHRVREEINPIDQNDPDNFVVEQVSGNDDAAWQHAKKNLIGVSEGVVKSLAAALKEVCGEKNASLFGTIEQFTDGVLRTGGYEDCKQCWREFYDEYKTKIWAEKFKTLADDKELRRQLENGIADVERAVKELR
ncbi:MAG: hypothetical protein LBT46_14895 [Planctomycetaceae bacterium]|jgi:GTPase SAR1 family protein|nr:hypothetical protein [Planctomycetaceae bacterium]